VPSIPDIPAETPAEPPPRPRRRVARLAARCAARSIPKLAASPPRTFPRGSSRCPSSQARGWCSCTRRPSRRSRSSRQCAVSAPGCQDRLPACRGARRPRCPPRRRRVRSRRRPLRHPGAAGRRPSTRPASIDVVIVPGVAFDERGVRIGFGGGFYDRLLPLVPQGRPHRRRLRRAGFGAPTV